MGVLYSGVITQGSLFHALFAQADLVLAIPFPHVIPPGLLPASCLELNAVKFAVCFSVAGCTHLVMFTNSADYARVSPVASLLYMMIPFFANYPIGPCCSYLNNSIVDVQLT